ncbi:hypothetical protein LSH36_6g13046 [Paralvinella palmiformis]|uniref:Dynein regulatory complex subunit 3 n=1 Tax=Paralvinella palmiformis TaxID=53620 RepID=A0AAD9KEK2_9ANNE|nr:hypothetical protein LSH36_6g13046 [Paralvinella palmiformis]
MSRLYDTIEPAVIDEEILQTAVEEQGPKEEAGKIAQDEGIDFSDVTSLRLDYKNILKIDNLWCFTSLVKLQLDNNIIEKIEGLDTLVNLIWLDLSFNNIEVIEGLTKLVKLEDLTLYNNRIQKIENLDTLKELHVFSIGNNDIKELDNVTYLRRFKKLQTLNISGNPISEHEDYKIFVVAHLPMLEYLDYRLVDKTSKQAAYEKYEIAILELQHDEKQAEKKAEEDLTKKKENDRHMNAYVEGLSGPYLFESMYAEDAEGHKLKMIPGVDELLLCTYKEKFTEICEQIFEYGLAKHDERMVEKDTFLECLNDAKNENKALAAEKIEDFLDYKKKLWADLNQISDQKMLEMSIAEYNQRTTALWEMLMMFEMQLVDQLEDAIKDFERNMSDMVSAFVETVQGYFTQCRDLENQHHERLVELSIITLEKVVKNEMDEEIPDDVRELFVDKDTIINAVSSSHDVHLLKIDNREDELITRINGWMTDFIEETHQKEEISRNRARVTEINNLIDHLRDELDNLDLQTAPY